jgi:hypothetical protein
MAVGLVSFKLPANLYFTLEQVLFVLLVWSAGKKKNFLSFLRD